MSTLSSSSTVPTPNLFPEESKQLVSPQLGPQAAGEVPITMYRRHPFPTWVNEMFDVKHSTFLEIQDDNRLYAYACNFILKHITQSFRGSLRRISHKSAETMLMERLAKERAKQIFGEAECKTNEAEVEEERCQLQLGLGLHKFRVDDEEMWALHQTYGKPVGIARLGVRMFTSLVVFVSGENRRDALQALCEECTRPKVVERVPSVFFQIYRWSNDCGRWNHAGKRIRRELNTIILPQETKTRVLDDMTRFLSQDSLRWYFKHGIPYKRSYLFYGVPGSGKSSLIQALAGHFQRNLCFLQPTHPKMSDEVFKTCLEAAPSPSLIVLEDVDALFGKDRSKKHADCPLTFSGLLNGLDGVGGIDGQIFILTTNFVERLDDALIRSGRVDLYCEFAKAVDEQIVQMFELFCPDNAELSDEFLAQARRVFPEGVSMAALQQHFIQQIFQPPRVIIDSLPQLGDRLDVVSEFDKRLAKAETATKDEDGATARQDEEEAESNATDVGVRG